MLGYVKARDVLYILDGRADLVVVAPTDPGWYPPAGSAYVLDPAFLEPVKPDDEDLECYYRCSHPKLMRLVMPTPSPALWLGHRVVVASGETAGQTGLIEEVRKSEGATETLYYAEVHRLRWDLSSEPSIFRVPVASLARHAFDRTPHLQQFDKVLVVGSTRYACWVGRVVDVCGFSVAVSVAASAPWRDPSNPCSVILGQRSFAVKVDALRQYWEIDDVFLVQAGEHIGSLATAARAGKGDIIQLVKVSGMCFHVLPKSRPSQDSSPPVEVRDLIPLASITLKFFYLVLCQFL